MNLKSKWLLIIFSCTVLCLLNGSSFAQINISPVERADYTEAMKITDPQKKIGALEKFLTDYPNSQLAIRVHLAIFSALVRTAPEQKDRITETIKKIREVTPEFNRPVVFRDLANILYETDILPDEALKLAKDGLMAQASDLPANGNKRPLASYYALIGRICLKQGKLKEAESNLKDALSVNPRFPAAFVGLAEIALRKNDEKAALDHFLSAAVAGKISATTRKHLEELYAKAHNGNLNDLERMLDEKYNKLNPPPFRVDEYKPGKNRTSHVALAEVFTGAGCPPCVAADLAFELMMERYKRQELVVLMYHLHVPQPDPMTNPGTQARGKFYGLQGVPGYALDGKYGMGGGSRDATEAFYNRVNPTVEKQLEAEAGAELSLEATLDNGIVKTKTVVNKLKGEAASLKLHIVLAEDHLRYMGENGVRYHPMVVRSLAGENAGGIPLTASSKTIEWSFDLTAISASLRAHLDNLETTGFRGDRYTFSEKKDKIDADNLTVVAFVQDAQSKAVLQTISVKVKRAVAGR